MACESFTREFENSVGEKVLVATRQLAATQALTLYIELMGKMGVSVLPFIDNKYNFNDIIVLMRATGHEQIVELMKRVIGSAAVEGAEIGRLQFDKMFSGELMLACKVFAFVLEANYQSFFVQGLALNEQRKLEAGAQSKEELQK